MAKGGSQSTQVQIPAWLEDAAKGNLARANEVSQIGYRPYFGPDVAAMGGGQLAAMQGTNAAASAFGLGQQAMPAQAQDFGGGVRGYSSGAMFEQALAELQQRRPGQFNAMQGMFINPVTGAAPNSATFGVPMQPAPVAAPVIPGPSGPYNHALDR